MLWSAAADDSGCGAPLDGCCGWLSQAQVPWQQQGEGLWSSPSPALFPDMRTPCTQGVPLHHQLMRDPTVQFSRNRPRHGLMRHLTVNSTQGDPTSRKARSPERRPPTLKGICLTHTPSHVNQWEPTGSQATSQTAGNGPAAMSPHLSTGSKCSAVSAVGVVATPGGALSTWAPLQNPTDWVLCRSRTRVYVAAAGCVQAQPQQLPQIRPIKRN